MRENTGSKYTEQTKELNEEDTGERGKLGKQGNTTQSIHVTVWEKVFINRK